MKYLILITLLITFGSSQAMEQKSFCAKVCNFFSPWLCGNKEKIMKAKKPVTQILLEQIEFAEHCAHINPAKTLGANPGRK
ncbi:hypothetical protein Noda2021_12080 [Candidatus Dependentiae bacterium Noda2021]|nr:hypothetical protein Noda2021_12080 [Candidatus Dependentiae bacterium Noda2021]